MAEALNIISLENDLFRTYLFYCSVLVLKMLVMGPLTGATRRMYKAYANPEDAALKKLKPKTDENVERMRRAHLNDLENIPIFFVASFVYILTNPSLALATMLFRVFVAARIVHTVVYAIFVVRQPARAVAYGAGLVVTIYMAVQGLLHLL